MPHLLAISIDLKARGIAFRSLTEQMDTNTPHGELLILLFGALAQYERALTRERVNGGTGGCFGWRNQQSFCLPNFQSAALDPDRYASSDRLGGALPRLTGGFLPNTGLKWTQDQTIPYEAVLKETNDVIAGYGEPIAAEQDRPAPEAARIDWLEMRTDHATAIMASLDVTDTDNVRHALIEYSRIVRARDNSAPSERVTKLPAWRTFKRKKLGATQ